MLDSNVAVGWLFPEQDSDARNFIGGLRGDDELVGAPLLLAECASVIRREIYARRLEHDLGMRGMEILLGLPIRIVDSRTQYTRALELARQFRRRTAYDMLHLAVAESEGAALVTFDRGLQHAAREIDVPVIFSQ